MDRIRNKSKYAAVKKWLIGGLLSALLLSGTFSIMKIDFESRRVDRDTLLVDTVVKGKLEIRVSANGTLLPRDLELVSAQVEGRVARVHVAPGDEVLAGQVLAELTNPQIINASEEAYLAWEGAVAGLKAFEVELSNNLLNQEVLLLQAKFAYEKEVLQLEAERQLHSQSIISDIDYRKTTLNVQQLEQTVVIERKRLNQSRDNMDTLLSVRKSRVTQLARVLDRAQDRVNNLNIIAGIGGMVQEFNLELGQQLTMGSPVGSLARQEFLYAELKVAARQAGDVIVGQNVVIDTRNGTVAGTVSRIDPAVTAGTVVVDVEIMGELPKGARPQLKIEGIIYIAQIADALSVGKPMFSRTNAEVSIYKLDDASEYAERINIRLGRSSVNRVEILEGLAPGDQVILSDSSDWQGQSRILLN